MAKTLIGIHAKLTKNGEKEIDLLVHSDSVGHPSPCVVITDWSDRRVIGGFISSLEQMFADEVAKHPGYAVQERTNIIAEVGPKPTENGDRQS